MFVAATLSLLAAVLPQGATDPGSKPPAKPAAAQDGQPGTVLSERELDDLHKKLREYLAADQVYFTTTDKAHEKARKPYEKAKHAFEEAWAKAEKKGNVLGSMADLRAMFFNCFERERPKHSAATLHTREIKDDVLGALTYGIYVPKAYKPEEPMPLVISFPGQAANAGEWTKFKDWFETAWAKGAPLEGAIAMIPQIPEHLEMDPIPDYNRDGAEGEEDRRNRTLFVTLNEMLTGYNIDRGRIFLDCARGTCGYVVRMLTLFPDRFAGAVLREPVAVEDLRLGNLVGIPLLLLSTPATKDRIEALQKRIHEFSPGTVTVLEAKGQYPHAESDADILAWMKDKQLSMSPKHVVLEPNHDRFNRAFWVDIIVADSLLTTAPDKKPRLEVTADRAQNRILVKAVGVERFELLLNDDLVDLDKEFTVVVNDKPVSEKRNRSFWDMLERMLKRSNWDCLFPVVYTTTVPKE